MTSTARRRFAPLAVAALALTALADAHAGEPGTPLFPVRQDGKWGFVDRTGKLVVTPRFDAASPFSEGLASVRAGGKLGYADATGALVLVPELAPAGVLHRPFVDGRAVVRKDQRFGFIDREGRLALPARWLTAQDFAEGRALVCDEQGCGWLDAAGRYLTFPMLMGGTAFQDGFAGAYFAMGMSRKRVAFVTRDGARSSTEYEDAGSYAEGLAPVRVGMRWGFVDAQGKPAIPSRYDEAAPFSEGLAAVKLPGDGRCGYVDRGGKLVIGARFTACHPFRSGRARVDLAANPSTDAERVGFIDREGNVVIRGDAAKPPFLAASDFRDGLAAVSVGGPLELVDDGTAQLGYIDPSGRYVWPATR